MLKAQQRRLVISLITLTACFSLAGVGFSAWTSSNGNSATQQGNFETDPILPITSNVDSIQVDPFCREGFLINWNNGYEISPTGHIKINFSIDLTNYQRTTEVSLSVNAVVTSIDLHNPNFCFDFSKVTQWNYGYSTTPTPTLSSSGQTISGRTCTVDYGHINIPTSVNKYYFGIDYTITKSTNFESDIYDHLSDTKFAVDIGYNIN